MTDQNTFMEVLREVAEIMRTSESPISEEEIMNYFADMDLNEGHKRLIIDYLNNPANIEPDGSNKNEFEETGSHESEVDYGQSGLDVGSEDSKVLRAYMEDLSLLKTYTYEEKVELYKQLSAGDKDVIDTISALWLGKVLDIAKKYMDLHSKVEDLIQEGNVALLVRLNELCGTESLEETLDIPGLERVLSYSIEKSISDYVSEWNGAKEQENILLGKLSLIHEASQFLEAENGTMPTISELAEYTNMSVEELSEYDEYLKNILKSK